VGLLNNFDVGIVSPRIRARLLGIRAMAAALNLNSEHEHEERGAIRDQRENALEVDPQEDRQPTFRRSLESRLKPGRQRQAALCGRHRPDSKRRPSS
jgi:hypothetical protein